jgi:hypothetical protein
MARRPARSLLGVRYRRRQTGGKFRLHKASWIDPFPSIPGTEPEKRIFAALVQRQIFFIYQGQIPELQRGLYSTFEMPGFKPDFILPQYRCIVDPFSPYHHTLPDAVARDAKKFVLYTSLGYKFYYPWAVEPGVFDFAQEPFHLSKQQTASGKRFRQAGVRGRYSGGLAVLSAIPELNRKPVAKLTERQERLFRLQGYELGPYVGAGASSVGAANRRRRKPVPHGLSVR